MKLFDSHCHLNHDDFSGKKLSEAYKKAIDAGVIKMMVVGYDDASSTKAVKIAGIHEKVFAAVGIHPHYVSECSENVLKHLTQLTPMEKVRAWGEIGLDFYRMLSPQKDQEHWLIRQLETADELKLPLIFHERDSSGRLIEILTKHPNPERKAVVHCFSGNSKELDHYLSLGFYIGITGILTIKSRGKFLRSIVKDIPQDRILIETDAPYLVPAPEKNKIRRNEPAFVKSVLIRLADILEISSESLSQITFENASRLFKERSL